MTPSPIGGRIHLTLQPAAGLHSGDTVVVHVLKRLDAGKWAVGVRGRVYPASSELPLEPGSVLRARVSASAGKMVFTISDIVPDALLNALQLQGIPRGGAEEVIARTLARAGLPLLPETIQKVKSLLTRAGLDERKSARSAVTLVDKRIDPASPGAAALLRVLAFGQKGGGDPRRYRGRPLPETLRAVKEFVDSLPAKTGSPSWALQAFNHSSGRTQSWVVIPFVFTTGSREDRRDSEDPLRLHQVASARPCAYHGRDRPVPSAPGKEPLPVGVLRLRAAETRRGAGTGQPSVKIP